MRRHCHHRTFTVAHQYIVAYPYRHLFAGERMGNLQASIHALLFHRRDIRFRHATMLTLVDECSKRGITLCSAGCQRMLGSDCNESDTHDGVGTCGIYPQLVLFSIQLIRESEAHTIALANPVALHGLNLFRPAFQLIQVSKQLLGILGNAHEIHRDVALFHQRAGTPAAPINHLFIGQHGMIHRIPVYRRRLLVNQPFLKQACEQPLLPAVIIRFASRHFARPVDAKSQAL